MAPIRESLTRIALTPDEAAGLEVVLLGALDGLALEGGAPGTAAARALLLRLVGKVAAAHAAAVRQGAMGPV